MRKKWLGMGGLLGAGLLGAALFAGATSAASVDPIFVNGNPTCADLGYPLEYKVDPPDAGTYNIPGVGSITVVRNGAYFDWTSTFGIDAVIAKGGPNANLYVYDPESFGDTNLASPINAGTGMPYGLSHISFCYDLELEVTKTANTSLTRTYTWDIDKSVAPATWNLFKGDSGTSAWTVEVDKTTVDSKWAVSGTIMVKNPAAVSATVTGVTDMISGFGPVAVTCPSITFPYTLPAGQWFTCTYSSALPNADTRTNTATATTTGPVGGGSGTASVDFSKATVTEVGYPSVNVTDTNGMSWGPVSADASWTYDETFTCDADKGAHKNVATITETGQKAEATATVNCYALEVKKDAATSLDRKWTWDITKKGDQSSLLLSLGQTFTVNYEVKVSATKADNNYAVAGKIAVYNPAPMAATINSVADVISPDVAANVNCGVTFPYSLAAAGTLNCTYSATLPDASERTNTATATLQNYSYSKTLVATATGTTAFSGTAKVDFSKATVSETDECINVVDDKYGSLGTVCASDSPKTFKYSLNVGPYEVCGEYSYKNIASFETNDTKTKGSDSWTVLISVPCQDGCTLTPGYWKTHSLAGPAPYDDTWAMVDFDHDGMFEGGAEDFFFSGKTYYGVLWTAPSGGNAYYILAHAYIAARLNIENGASTTSAVDAAMAGALAYFHTPTNTGSPAPKGAERTMLLGWAYTLDMYNNGLIGPGHCSE